MTPAIQRFLEIATRPLEKRAGDRVEGEAELMSRLGASRLPYDQLDLSQPTARLESRTFPVPRLRAWAVAIGLIACVVTVVAHATKLSFQAFESGSMWQRLSYFQYDPTASVPKELGRIAPTLPIGLYGGPDRESATLAWLEKHPDDIAIWQEHILRRIETANPATLAITEEEASTIQRLDPDNALWPWLEAAMAMKRSVALGNGPGQPGEADLHRSRELFSLAATKPFYRDHSVSMGRRMIDAFPRPGSYLELVMVHAAHEVPTSFGHHRNRSFQTSHSDRISTAMSRDDADDFRRMSEDFIRLLHVIAAEKSVLGAPEELLRQLHMIAARLEDAAGKQGIAEEKTRMEAIKNALPPSQWKYYTMPAETTAQSGPRLRLTHVLPRSLTPEEVARIRGADVAMFDRFGAALASVVALLLTLAIGLEMVRRNARVRGLARGLMPLLKPVDHVWIGGLGLALPWLWWWGIARLSPLGNLDMKFEEEFVVGMLIQWSAGVALSFLLLRETARWRWQIRGGFLALGGPLWPGRVAAACALLAIPAVGALRYLTLSGTQSELYLLGCAGLASFGLVWLLWDGAMNLFTGSQGALRPNVAMRAMLPWAIAATFTLVGGSLVSAFNERRFMEADPLSPPWTSKVYTNALEERAVAEIKAVLSGL